MTRSFRPGRVAADAAGNAYIAGDTSSADFPVGGAGADTTYGGGVANPSDGFYVKLGPTGAFLYGTFMGGIDYDWTTGIASTRPATSTSAAARPRTAAASRRPPTPTTVTANGYDAFLSKFDAAGTRVYSTFFGGIGGEQLLLQLAGGLAVDDQGRAYLTGDTYSTDLPTVNGFQTGFGGGNAYDAYVAVIDTTQAGAARLVYSTYLGGNGTDLGMGIAYAGNRQSSTSPVRPTPGSRPPTPSMPPTTAATATPSSPRSTRRRPARRRSLYSTFLGGIDSPISAGTSPSTPRASSTWWARRDSTDFPQVGAISTHINLRQPFVAKINAAGTTLLFSSYFGGGGNGKWAHGRRHQRRRATPSSPATPTTRPTNPRRRPASRSPTRSRASTAAAASDAFVVAHRQRRRPAADQDRVAGAGRRRAARSPTR